MTNNKDLYIDGQWTKASRPNPISVYNPCTEEEIGTVADADSADAIRSIDAADKAAEAWAGKSARERSEILRRCWEIIMRDADKFAHLISLENGKSLTDAKGEVAYAAEFFRWFAEECVRSHGEYNVAPNGANRVIVHHKPIGISLLITPWNFPAAMATRKIAPALAAGCTCILKPATETPLTAYAVVEALEEAGVPAGVVNVITSSTTKEVVDTILEDPRVRKVSFTGSTEVGRILLEKSAEQIIHPSMELGGNAPVIVFDDADMDKAIDGVMMAKMRNGGSACTAANRIYVQKGIADKFIAKFTDRMQALKMGNATDASTELGALVNAKTAEKIAQLVDDAVAKGAKVICGGERTKGKGHFYPATVLTDIPDNADIVAEEIFGPVAAFYKFDTEEEAIKRANDTEYGLVSYVFSSDVGRGIRVCEAMDSGMIAFNRGLVSDPSTPFGGTKQSGLGREGASHGMLEFMEQKYIAADF